MTPDPTLTAIQRVEAIKARLEKATPGKWRVDTNRIAVSPPINGYDRICDGFSWGRIGDMELIAHAPTDLAYLLDALAQAKKECALLKMQVDAMAGELPRAVQENLERAVVAEKHLAQVTQALTTLQSTHASNTDFLNTCLREATLDHKQIHSLDADLRTGIDALYSKAITLENKMHSLESRLTQAEAVVEAAEHIQICPASCNYEGHIEELICKRAWEKLEDALTAFRQGRGGG